MLIYHITLTRILPIVLTFFNNHEMEKTRNKLATRYYQVPKNMSNEDIAMQMSHGTPPVFLQEDGHFAPSPGSPFLGFRSPRRPEILGLMAGWDPEVYGKAERLFRQLSDQEADDYEETWPDPLQSC